MGRNGKSSLEMKSSLEATALLLLFPLGHAQKSETRALQGGGKGRAQFAGPEAEANSPDQHRSHREGGHRREILPLRVT